MKLPEKRNDTLVVWHDHERAASGPTRVVLVANGNSRWSMRTEGGQLVDEDDPDITVSDDRTMWTSTHLGGDYVPCEEYEDGKLYEWKEDADSASFCHSLGDPNWRQGLNALVLALPKLFGDLSRWCLSGPQQVERPTLSWDSLTGAVISKTKGNRQLIVTIVGENQLGEPVVEVHTNKALNPREWLVAVRALAHALDNFRSDCEG